MERRPGKVIKRHTDSVNGIRFWRNYLVSCSSDGFVRIYDIQREQLVRSLSTEENETFLGYVAAFPLGSYAYVLQYSDPFSFTSLPYMLGGCTLCVCLVRLLRIRYVHRLDLDFRFFYIFLSSLFLFPFSS